MLRITDLRVAYGDVVAVDGVELAAADGEVVGILGPSGCGKSTLLRAVAGLERPVTGSIELDGEDVTLLRPDERRVGLMFQQHALFPHRTVADNIAFGPRMRGLAAGEVAARVDEALALVDLDGFGGRAISTLSGGEAQRVALARAIAPRPRLLMLDEPLGSLDRRLRDHLVGELGRVFAALGTTVLYVTHDQSEALALADRVAVMRSGRIVRLGAPDAVWRDPRSEFVARFVGHDHVLDGEVADREVMTPLGRFPAPTGAAPGPVRLLLLPEALHLIGGDEVPPEGEVALDGEVVGRRFAGDHLLARIRLDGDVEVGVTIVRGAGPAIGDPVRLSIDPAALRLVT